MTKRVIILIIIFQFLLASSFAQSKKENNLLTKYEFQVLDILTTDTSTDVNLKLNYEDFKFGINNLNCNESNLIKHRKKMFLQPIGTGRIYSIKKAAGQYQIERLDSTVYFGANFFAYNFYLRDTLFQYGGNGYWTLRGFLTYFSNETKQWELYQANKEVVNIFDPFRKVFATINLKSNTPRLFVSNSMRYVDFPNSFDIQIVDSCYEFDLNNRKWKTIGAFNPKIVKINENRESPIFEFEDYFMFESQLGFYWGNFSSNSFGKLKDYKTNELRQKWLDINSKYSKSSSIPIQFNLGDTIYLCKINSNKELDYRKIEVKLKDFNFSNPEPLYIVNSSFSIAAVFEKNVTIIYILLTIILIAILLLLFNSNKKNKKSVTSEVSTILNNNFFNSLTVIEKELIEVLYTNHQKGEEISTKLINKIIGVQQKDTLTQNKSRSDYFIRINQKYKLATQQEAPLVVKNRDAGDKRQYNYTLNDKYILYIEKFIKRAQ